MATQSNDRILTLIEAAELLKVSDRTLWVEAKAGNVPCFRVGRQYRFVLAELLAWAKEQQQPTG